MIRRAGRLLTASLDLRLGENRPVALLLAASVLLGLVSVFLSSAATAIFLQAFDADALPYLYVASAALVATSGWLYTKLESRLPISRLLPGTILVLLFSVCAVRLSLALPGQRWPAVLLAGFGELAASFVPLTFWALAGRLFDVRQAKRLFGPIGAGEVAATSLGGFAAPLVVRLIGTPNLLWICAAALAGMAAIFVYIFQRFGAQIARSGNSDADEQRLRLRNAARNHRGGVREPYVVLMLGFAGLAVITYYVVSTIFLVQAKHSFPHEDQLAGFLGVFTGVLSLISFAGRSVVAGKIMSRFGIRVSLLATPVTVAVTAAAVLAASSVLGPGAVLFYANSLNRISLEVTWDCLYKPAYLVLYQPLPARSRLWLQTVVESIAAPLAQGIAGLGLIAYNAFFGGDVTLLSGAAVVVAGAWTACAGLTGRRYVSELLAAVTARTLDLSQAVPGDPAGLAVLELGLRSDRPDEALYCLSVLDSVAYPRLNDLLLGLLDHPSPQVRVDALHRIEKRQLRQALEHIRRVLDTDTSPAVRAAALTAVGAIDPPAFLATLAAALEDPQIIVRRAALVALLSHGGATGGRLGHERLDALLTAPAQDDRVLAAEVIGESGARGLYDLLPALLQDPSGTVRGAALRAAGRLNHPLLWPMVIQRLVDPITTRAASAALLLGGEAVVPLLAQTFAGLDGSRALRHKTVRACGRIRGPAAVVFLRQTLDFPDLEIRTTALRALVACHYQASERDAPRIVEMLSREIAAGAWYTAAELDFGDDLNTLPAHLRQTFAAELDFARERAMLLLALLFDRAAVIRCASLLHGADAERRAYALEILDNLIPHTVKETLFPLLEDHDARRRLTLLEASFRQVRLSQMDRVISLISRSLAWAHPWTVACWVHAAGTLAAAECLPAVVAAAGSPSPLVQETAAWALARLRRLTQPARLTPSRAESGWGSVPGRPEHQPASASLRAAQPMPAGQALPTSTSLPGHAPVRAAQPMPAGQPQPDDPPPPASRPLPADSTAAPAPLPAASTIASVAAPVAAGVEDATGAGAGATPSPPTTRRPRTRLARGLPPAVKGTSP